MRDTGPDASQSEINKYRDAFVLMQFFMGMVLDLAFSSSATVDSGVLWLSDWKALSINMLLLLISTLSDIVFDSSGG